MTLATRIVIFDKGRIQQVGTPAEVFNQPANVFVAGFIGTPTMNLLAVRLIEGTLRGDGFSLQAPDWLGAQNAAGRVLTVGFRPQDVRVTQQGALRMQVAVCEYLGTESQLVGPLVGQGPRLVITVPGNAHDALHHEVTFDVPPEQLHVFDTGTGRSLRH